MSVCQAIYGKPPILFFAIKNYLALILLDNMFNDEKPEFIFLKENFYL